MKKIWKKFNIYYFSISFRRKNAKCESYYYIRLFQICFVSLFLFPAQIRYKYFDHASKKWFYKTKQKNPIKLFCVTKTKSLYFKPAVLFCYYKKILLLTNIRVLNFCFRKKCLWLFFFGWFCLIANALIRH